MKKERLHINKGPALTRRLSLGGFSLVEVILASAVFLLFVTAFVGAYLYGEESTMLAGNRARAVMLAEEGLEAVRSIRDPDFTNLTDGNYGLTSGNQWSFSGSSDDTDNFFTRVINISTIDDNRKEITSTVTWQQNAQRNGEVTVSSILTDWLKPVLYSVTYEAGDGGSISGNLLQSGLDGILYEGEGTWVQAVPDLDKQFVGWDTLPGWSFETDPNNEDIPNPTRKDTNITSNRHIVANFGEITYYDLIYDISPDLSYGYIQGNASQSIPYGGSGTEVTAVANSGYAFVGWDDSNTNSTRTDTGIIEDTNFTAIFVPEYTLTYIVGMNGTITGDLIQTVSQGGDGVEVIAVADTGYHFLNWDDGVLTENRTDTNVQGDINVTANFETDAISYDLTYIAGDNGNVQLDGEPLETQIIQTVLEGESGITITAVPDSGYYFAGWSDDIFNTDPVRTDFDVQGDINVTANFKISQGGMLAYLHYIAANNYKIRSETLDGAGSWFNLTEHYTNGYKVKIFSAPTRNEKILIVQMSSNILLAYVWDGVSWSSPTTMTDTNGPGSNINFDGAYGYIDGVFTLVYSDNTTNTTKPRYRTWDGSSWSVEKTMNNTVVTWRPSFIVLKTRPDTNEKMLAILDENRRVYTSYFNGLDPNNFNNWSPSVLHSASNIAPFQMPPKLIDFEWSLSNPNLGVLVFSYSGESDTTPDTKLFTANGSGGVLAGPMVSANVAQTNSINSYEISSSNGGITKWKICDRENSTFAIRCYTVNSSGIISADNPDGNGMAGSLAFTYDTYSRPQYFDINFETQDNGNNLILTWTDGGPNLRLKKYNLLTSTWDTIITSRSFGGQVDSVHSVADPNSNDIIIMSNADYYKTIVWDGNSDAFYTSPPGKAVFTHNSFSGILYAPIDFAWDRYQP